MLRPPPGPERTLVTFSASPSTHTWAALCLACAGALLALGWGLALSEKARASRVDLAEIVLAPRLGIEAAPR